ncbi:hypothetical protein PWP93_27030 [Paraburkholderia sp. A1RI-2L]
MWALLRLRGLGHGAGLGEDTGRFAAARGALPRNDAPLDGAAVVGVARSQRAAPALLSRRCRRGPLLREVADAYHGTRKQSPEALGYLTQRGLVHGELVDSSGSGMPTRA